MLIVRTHLERIQLFYSRNSSMNLKTPVAWSQMVETLTFASEELKVCLDASWLGLQPERQKWSSEWEGGILIFSNRGALQNRIPVYLGCSMQQVIEKQGEDNVDSLCPSSSTLYLSLSFFSFSVKAGDFLCLFPSFLLLRLQGNSGWVLRPKPQLLLGSSNCSLL